MRHEVECCCGAQATFDTSGRDDSWVRGCVTTAYERWMKQHDGCPARYTNPTAEVGTAGHEPGKRDSAPAERVGGPACTTDRESGASHSDGGTPRVGPAITGPGLIDGCEVCGLLRCECHRGRGEIG